MKTLLRLSLFVLLAAACAWPDIPPPPSPGERIKMRIGKDNTATGGPVLEIPSKLFHQHAGVFGDEDRFRMFAAGVLLSAAIFLAGRWFWKRRERQALAAGTTPAGARSMMMVVVGGAALLGASLLVRTVSADDSGPYNSGNIYLAGEQGTLEGTVAVQISNGDTVVLHLTPPRRRPGPPPPVPHP